MKPSYHSHVQYAVYSDRPELEAILTYIQNKDLEHEIHLNRTRFWIQRNTPVHTEFMLKFYHAVSEVKE